MKKIILLIYLIGSGIITNGINAQTSISGGFGWSISEKIKTPSFHVGGLFGIGDGTVAIIGDFRCFIPSSFTHSVQADAINYSTNPPFIDVKITNNISFSSISGGIRKYLMDDDIESGGLFGSISLGLIYSEEKVSIADFDRSLYTLSVNERYHNIRDRILISAIGTMELGCEYKMSEKLFFSFSSPITISAEGVKRVVNDDGSYPLTFVCSIVASIRYVIK